MILAIGVVAAACAAGLFLAVVNFIHVRREQLTQGARLDQASRAPQDLTDDDRPAYALGTAALTRDLHARTPRRRS